MENKKVIELCKTNPYVKTLILALAEEYKPEKVTSALQAVDVLRIYEINVAYWQIIALFRQLEGLGCGTFFIGRKGKKSRFYWDIDIKVIAKEIADSAIEKVSVPGNSVQTEVPSPKSRITTLRHPFHLRQDFELVFELPADLTEKESQRIAKFVESLPQ